MFLFNECEGLFKIYFEGKNINNISKLWSVEEKFLQVSTVYQQVIQQYIQLEDEEDEEEEDIVDDIINIVFKLYFFMSGEFVVIYWQCYCNSFCLYLEVFDDCILFVIFLNCRLI